MNLRFYCLYNFNQQKTSELKFITQNFEIRQKYKKYNKKNIESKNLSLTKKNKIKNSLLNLFAKKANIYLHFYHNYQFANLSINFKFYYKV